MMAAPSGRVTKPTPNVASAPNSRPNCDSAGKKRVADHHREKGKDQEIVELEPVADNDCNDAFEWERDLRRRGRAGQAGRRSVVRHTWRSGII